MSEGTEMPNPPRRWTPAPTRHSQHFFQRQDDGTVRLRIRFDNDEASLFEEAAGETPVMVWLHRTLEAAAKRQVKEARRKRAQIAPPRGEA